MKLKTCPICRGEMPNVNGRRYCSFGCWLCARDPKLCELAKKHGKLESVSNFQERSRFELVTSKESPDLLAQTIISELNHSLDEAGAFPEPRLLDRDYDICRMKEIFMITGWRPVNIGRVANTTGKRDGEESMSKPITVLERKPVETELVEREYTYEELLELFPDGGESIVNPLVRRCQEYEAAIERLQNENQGRMEEGMSKYSDLDMMIDVHDPKTYIDGCKCDPDVNYTCKLCMTYNTLKEAKRMLLLRDTEIERLKKACELYRQASIQSHKGHWGPTRKWGAGCPECDRASQLRSEAEAALKEEDTHEMA